MPLLVIALALILWATWNSRAGLAIWIRTIPLSIKATFRSIHEDFTWQMPGKIETSAEWFQELRADKEWSVRSGSYGFATA